MQSRTDSSRSGRICSAQLSPRKAVTVDCASEPVIVMKPVQDRLERLNNSQPQGPCEEEPLWLNRAGSRWIHRGSRKEGTGTGRTAGERRFDAMECLSNAQHHPDRVE